MSILLLAFIIQTNQLKIYCYLTFYQRTQIVAHEFKVSCRNVVTLERNRTQLSIWINCMKCLSIEPGDIHNGPSNSRSLLWQGIGISSIYLEITATRLYGLSWYFESTYMVLRPYDVYVRILHSLPFSNRDWFVSLLSIYGQTPLPTVTMFGI